MTMWTKDSSPLTTRNVLRNLVEALEKANVSTISVQHLRDILDECERELSRQMVQR
jgi:Ca2+-binding EF-hand superfamily protein